MFCSGCSKTRKKIVVSINSEVEEFCRGAEGCQIEERSHQTSMIKSSPMWILCRTSSVMTRGFNRKSNSIVRIEFCSFDPAKSAPPAETLMINAWNP
jgi:hypothetical protein